MSFFRRKETIRVLVATRHPDAYEALAELQAGQTRVEKRRVEAEVTEALSTRGAYGALPGCTLAVIDPGDLVVSPDLPRATLEGALAQAGIPTVGGKVFAAEPVVWIERAIAAVGLLDALPPRTVMITGYSGGVGKTTLACNLARYVAGELRLPAAVVEVCFGRSALQALAGDPLPDLHDVVTQGATPGQWQQVTMLPMNYASARLLLNRLDEVGKAFDGLAASHALTVVDAAAANPFRPQLQAATDRTLVVADPRPDAIANLHAMVHDLGQEVENVDLVLNNVNGLGDKLALSGVEAALKLPHVPSPRQDKRLAEGLLQVIYPGWRPG